MRAGNVSVKNARFSDVFEELEEQLGLLRVLGVLGDDEAPAAEDRRGLLALGMRDRQHADVDVGVLLADRGDVELAGLVGRDLVRR